MYNKISMYFFMKLNNLMSAKNIDKIIFINSLVMTECKNDYAYLKVFVLLKIFSFITIIIIAY